MKVLTLAIVLFLSFQAGFAQRSDSYADLVEEVMPSIVLVNTFDRAGNGLKSGTGFCVAPSFFITNYHVIEGAAKLTIRTSDNRTFSVNLDALNKNADLALMRTGNELDVKPLKFAPILPKVGEKIVVVGNPLGLTGTVSDGIVSAIREGGEEYVQITAPISPGSSGSPVLNLRGDVIGIATLNLKGGQNLNFAISSGYIQDLWPNKFAVASASKPPEARKLSFRWRLLDDEDTTYDKQTLSKVDNIVSVWINYSEKDGSYQKVLNELNCSTRKIHTVQSNSYNSKGDLSGSSSVSSDWQAIIPETKGESYFEVLCKGRPDRQSEIELDEFLKAGETYEKDGNLAAATESYWKALGLAFDSNYEGEEGLDILLNVLQRGDAEIGLERIYEKQNNVAGFEKLYNFEISKGELDPYPKFAALYKKRGMAMKFRSTALSGINILEQKVKSKKTDGTDFIILSDLYSLLNQPQKAIAILVNGLARFQNDDSLAKSLGTIYNKYKRWKDCTALIEKVLPNADIFRKDLLTILKTAYDGMGDSRNADRIAAELRGLK